MKEFAYGNATTNDLWAAWQKSSGKNIPELMDAWTKQTGFPVLELQKVNSDGSLVLEQRRFFADGAADTENTKWPVPLFASVDGTQQSIGVMSSQKETVPFADAKNAKWVKFNAGQHAPLRVRYPDAMLPHLFEAISSKKLPPADRIGLLSDGAALSKAGLMPFGRFLELLGAYKNEDDATVWSQLLEKLMSLGKILRGGDDTTLSEAYDGFARSLIVPVLERCGWAPRDEDAHLTRKLRGEVIAALPTFCAADDGVYAEAKRRFDAFRAGDDAALALVNISRRSTSWCSPVWKSKFYGVVVHAIDAPRRLRGEAWRWRRQATTRLVDFHTGARAGRPGDLRPDPTHCARRRPLNV